ncbi:hypothetical protein [Clostridium algidicarnis]|uniref:hypothetical protein n=1 Tax=Clostridium algidicarnis TaxID=37659 RepID=UPI001C0B8FB4|nr:hypothetical protein [Clostridium algidicarnis]MBU3209817.1 hypothetical protein [Clostridium algidicarnis]MBU3228610.1 hypothetical protein [Clostridium algidicarnis]MBU3251913.1 hypothetical protein [Clostridium algidicarnis]
MHIEKAIKNQNRNLKIFMMLMISMFLILPLALFLYGNINWFLLSYMIFVEFMIAFATISKYNSQKIKFNCSNNKLKLKLGILGETTLIFCDKISIVHTAKSKEDIEIIIISNTKIKNKRAKPINESFYKRYPMLAKKYENEKKENPEKNYYFFIIKKGGFYKYNLLDAIYKNSVKAVYTDETIENIKIARGQKEFID